MQHFSILLILAGILSVILIALILKIILKWIYFYKIIRFRENLKPGTYCRFKLNGETVTGFVVSAWPDINNIHVRHQGIVHRVKLQNIFP